jgi:hypothetical protein
MGSVVYLLQVLSRNNNRGEGRKRGMKETTIK